MLAKYYNENSLWYILNILLQYFYKIHTLDPKKKKKIDPIVPDLVSSGYYNKNTIDWEA